MRCAGLCPACPVDRQHQGGLCPRLCMLRSKEAFWKERADLAFAEGFDGPTPGLSVLGWKRAGRWREEVGGGATPSEDLSDSSSSPVSPQSTAPSISPLANGLGASSASSPTTSFASPVTPVFKSAETASTVADKRMKVFLELKLPASSASISSSAAVDSSEKSPYTTQSTPSSVSEVSDPKTRLRREDRGRITAISGPQERTRSRSPLTEGTKQSYRDRSALRKSPLPVQVSAANLPALPAEPPSLSSLLSDPLFRTVVTDEVAAIVSARRSSYDSQQNAAIDDVIVAVFRAATTALRPDSQDCGYQPSESMKVYLDYARKHFPALISWISTGYRDAHTSQKGTDSDVHTYHGRAFGGTQIQDRGGMTRAVLPKHCKRMTECPSLPKAQSEKINSPKTHCGATSAPKKTTQTRSPKMFHPLSCQRSQESSIHSESHQDSTASR